MLYSTTFQYAGQEIEAAQDEQGNYWINRRTLENLYDWGYNRASEKLGSKSFKALAGEGYNLTKTTQASDKIPQKAVWYSVKDFLLINYWQDQEGNPQAKAIIIAGFTSDFMSSLNHAFGNQLAEDEKERLRKLVADRIMAFKAWTAVLDQRYRLLNDGRKPQGNWYRAHVGYVNKQLFGCWHFKCNRSENMTPAQQKTIKDFEELLVNISAKYIEDTPKTLIDKALKVYKFVF